MLVRSHASEPWGLQLEYQLYRGTSRSDNNKDQWGCFAVVDTRPDSPAARDPALRIGDTIVGVDGKRVSAAKRDDFAELLSILHSKGRAVQLTVARQRSPHLSPAKRIVHFEGNDEGAFIRVSTYEQHETRIELVPTRDVRSDVEKPEETDKHEDLNKLEEANKPDEANQPEEADNPEEGNKPAYSIKPEETDKPEETNKPEDSESAKETDKPEETDTPPQETDKPEDDKPEATAESFQEDGGNQFKGSENLRANEDLKEEDNKADDDLCSCAAYRLKFVPLDDETCRGARYAGLIARIDGNSRLGYEPLLVGDVLVSIDGESVVDLEYAAILAQLRRPPPISMVFSRAAQTPDYIPDDIAQDTTDRYEPTSSIAQLGVTKFISRLLRVYS